MTAANASLFDQAEERLEQDETFIKLEEKGDAVTFLVESFTMQNGKYGSFPIVKGTTRDGKFVALAGGRSVLKARLTENPPARGDVLSVRYEGEITSEKTGNTYHGYKVVLMAGDGARPAAIDTADEAASATAADNGADSASDW